MNGSWRSGTVETATAAWPWLAAVPHSCRLPAVQTVLAAKMAPDSCTRHLVAPIRHVSTLPAHRPLSSSSAGDPAAVRQKGGQKECTITHRVGVGTRAVSHEAVQLTETTALLSALISRCCSHSSWLHWLIELISICCVWMNCCMTTGSLDGATFIDGMHM